MYIGCHVKYIFFKNTQISNFMNIHPVGAKLFHVDRWTDMMKLIAAFHNFVKRPKKWSKIYRMGKDVAEM
jgi:hypothetical protein